MYPCRCPSSIAVVILLRLLKTYPHTALPAPTGADQGLNEKRKVVTKLKPAWPMIVVVVLVNLRTMPKHIDQSATCTIKMGA